MVVEKAPTADTDMAKADAKVDAKVARPSRERFRPMVRCEQLILLAAMDE